MSDLYLLAQAAGPVPVQTAAEGFAPAWYLLVGVVVALGGLLLVAFGIVIAAAGMRSGSATPPVPDAAPCRKCGSLVPLAKTSCPSCGARIA